MMIALIRRQAFLFVALLIAPNLLHGKAALDPANIAKVKKMIEVKKADLQQHVPQVIAMMQAIKFHEATVPPQQKGVRISGIPKDSVVAKIGLQNDDIILAINDIGMSQAHQGFVLFEELRKAKNFFLTVQRANRQITITINVK